MKKRHTLIIICIIVILYSITFLYNNITLVNVNNINCIDHVGIIDSNLSRQYHNVTFHKNVKFNELQDTHGDKMISFLLYCEPSANVYYFNASDENGHISTERIIEGLNWMVENSVTKVNISLSSKLQDDNFQDWIKKNNSITIYASYNNRLNSLDYPAKYEGVIASGSSPKIQYKDIDIKYRSNKILVFNNGLKLYNGNSYLSILSMLKD